MINGTITSIRWYAAATASPTMIMAFQVTVVPRPLSGEVPASSLLNPAAPHRHHSAKKSAERMNCMATISPAVAPVAIGSIAGVPPSGGKRRREPGRLKPVLQQTPLRGCFALRFPHFFVIDNALFRLIQLVSEHSTIKIVSAWNFSAPGSVFNHNASISTFLSHTGSSRYWHSMHTDSTVYST